MKKLSRRTFLEAAGAAAALWGLKPAIAQAAAGSCVDGVPTLSYPESVLRGLADFIDAHDGLATLLDGNFRVVRTSRSHQILLKYDPGEVYGRSGERSWPRGMQDIIKGIGGLHNIRRRGVYCMDFTVVKQPCEIGFGNEQPLVCVGRTVAIGNPRDPMAYLTTLRLADGLAIRSSAIIKCLNDPM